MVFTCASDGRHEHGTLRTSPENAPFLSQFSDEWANYYKNLNESDIKKVLDINNLFSSFEFQYKMHSSLFLCRKDYVPQGSECHLMK